MAEFLTFVLGFGALAVAILALMYLGEFVRFLKALPELSRAVNRTHEERRAFRDLESRIREIELRLTPTERLADWERLRLANFILARWLTFSRRQQSVGAARSDCIVDLAIGLRDVFLANVPRCSPVIQDSNWFANEVSTVLPEDGCRTHGSEQSAKSNPA
jgi:hypothetical protein